MTLDFPSLLTFPNESGLALRGWVCARTGHSALLFRWWFAPQIRPQPIQSTVFISHLTNSYGCGNLQPKVLLTVAPFRPFLPPQLRVSSRNQPLLASFAPRTVNISSILSRLNILPVATRGHPVARKSFPCHSYENIRDGGITSTAELRTVNT